MARSLRGHGQVLQDGAVHCGAAGARGIAAADERVQAGPQRLQLGQLVLHLREMGGGDVTNFGAEIVGRYLPCLWLKQGKSAWLLALNTTAAGRVYAAYGGIYIGVAICFVGMAVIMFGPRAE